MVASTGRTLRRGLRLACILTCLAGSALWALGGMAQSDAVAPQTAAVAAAAQRMGIYEMFLHADPVVKAVMLFLLLCSVATWTVLLEKSFLFARIRRNSEEFLAGFRRVQRVDQIGPLAAQAPETPLTRIWVAAQNEWEISRRRHGQKPFSPHQIDRLLQRMALAAGIAQEEELARLGNGMGLLATIGSTAPFIGLFGTVWGILHSFADIAAAKATSLSVVAPGIAEALLATAIGLFAAIPAVMIYNSFARSISRMTGTFDNFVAEFSTVASRELEEAL
ncbi:MAG: MotA/TolQ/ExbB proton channel family protein [Rhodocyclaceae bacterium]|nr:MotA/TolQ/ExbB proton channel family protein [Rhodocyclaceae bacterium]